MSGVIVSLPPFQHLVDAYWRDVARLAYALAGPDAGDDVAQQAWLQALAAYPKVRQATNLRGWLLTITHHCAVDDRRRRRAVPCEDPAGLPTASVSMSVGEPAPDLWATVGELPARQRDVVVLRFVGDLDHRAIAAALGISVPMSRRLLSDALATLRLDPGVTP